MQPVKRYDLESASNIRPVETESGGWVRWEDHEAAVRGPSHRRYYLLADDESLCQCDVCGRDTLEHVDTSKVVPLLCPACMRKSAGRIDPDERDGCE